jgi:phospholipid/cholesterol/gamma-HCH transport system ATP-binding protein
MLPAPAASPHAAAPVFIDVRHVSKGFQGQTILQDISLQVVANEVLAIIGPSGCGKSTLLRLIAGLETPDSGDIVLGDANLTMVFQYSALFDSMSVYDNVAFALREAPDEAVRQFHPKSEAEIATIVAEKLSLVGLDEAIATKLPNQLSGGMQKRVSFARAIVTNPRIILYDEPTAGLDPLASTVIEDYILKVKHELHAASVVVTHQFSTIRRTADRILMLNEGRVCWEGTPESLMSTDYPEARAFVQASLCLPSLDDPRPLP